MNRTNQSGLHPDAESLNAFVERELPDSEREMIVAHLAGCSRCRDIVFLARQAQEEDTAGSTATAPVPAAVVQTCRRPGMIPGWRAAWVPATAAAALAGVLIWTHILPIQKPIERAQNAPPPARSAPETPSPPNGPAVTEQPASAASSPVAAGNAGQAGRQISRSKRGAALPGSSSNPLDLPDAMGAQTAEREDSRSAEMLPSPPPSGGSALPQVLSNYAITRSAAQRFETKPQEQTVLSPQEKFALQQASEPGPQRPVQAFSVAPLGASHRRANELLALRATRNFTLPNGLRSVSSAAILNRLVAVDADGSLFLSHDAGRHWGIVTAQWQGKAIEIHTEPQVLFRGSDALKAAAGAEANNASGTQTSNGSKPNSSAEPSAFSQGSFQPFTPLVFKLVNDNRDIWVSSDGKVWRPATVPHAR